MAEHSVPFEPRLRIIVQPLTPVIEATIRRHQTAVALTGTYHPYITIDPSSRYSVLVFLDYFLISPAVLAPLEQHIFNYQLRKTIEFFEQRHVSSTS